MSSFESDLIAAVPALRRWAMRFYRNWSDADDAVQDALEQALISTCRPTTASVKTWVSRIVFFRFCEARKKKIPAYCGAPVDYAASIQANDDQHGSLEAKQTIGWAVSNLSRAKLDVVICHAMGFDDDETAIIVGCPVGTVKSRMHYAREKIRQNAA